MTHPVLETLAALVGIEPAQLDVVASACAEAFGQEAMTKDHAGIAVLAIWAARRAQSLSKLLMQLEDRGQEAMGWSDPLAPVNVEKLAGEMRGPYDSRARPIRADHPALQPSPDVHDALADMIELAMQSIKPSGWEARVAAARAALIKSKAP